MDSTRLVQIRRDFYHNIRKRVAAITGQESADLRHYREIYEKELNRLPWQSVDKKHFFSRLKTADIILVGDFHAQKQSTRGFMRILRKVKTPLVIGLECIRADDQKWLDQFMHGELSEKDFLSKVGWRKNWGFPWENYKPLFKWAQQNHIKVYGINAGASVKSLKQRDVYSAELIKRVSLAHKKHQIFVQYGDLHLASTHLPRDIKKLMPKADVCTVYQSPEILYFKIMEKAKELSTDVVRLTADKWALNGLPPWIKWQDYLLYLESGQDKRIAAQEVDPTDTVASTVLYLSKLLGLKVSLDALSVYTSDDNSFFDIIEAVPIAVRNKIIENVKEGVSFYSPEIQGGYLARYSVNHVLRVAAQYLYFCEGGYTRMITDPRKDFLKMIWLESVIYFFSKVKNPKRKTDTLQDIRMALQKEQFDDRGKEALTLALTQKLSEMQFLSLGKFRQLSESEQKKYAKKSFFIAAQIIGGIMGEKMFYAFSKHMLQMPRDKKLLFKQLNDSNYSKIYYESLEMVESWPVSFKSKFDKL